MIYTDASFQKLDASSPYYRPYSLSIPELLRLRVRPGAVDDLFLLLQFGLLSIDRALIGGESRLVRFLVLMEWRGKLLKRLRDLGGRI